VKGTQQVDANDYLRQLVDGMVASAGRLPSNEIAIGFAAARGVATGLTAAGAITSEEADVALAPLDRIRLPKLDWITKKAPRLQNLHFSIPEHTVTTAAPPLPQGQSEIIPPSHREHVARLIRVLPLGKTIHSGAAGDAIAVSLEVWSTHCVLHLAYPGVVTDVGERLRHHLSWEAKDDTGVLYLEKASHWSDAMGTLTETRVFAPGASPAAQTLRISAARQGNDVDFTLSLQEPRSSGGPILA
jgi:hypothetical protein